jgi:hypothetical protein
MSRDNFSMLYALFEDLSAGPVKTEEELWDYIIRKTSSVIGCHAATFFEADEVKKTLTFRRSTGPVGADIMGVSFGYQGIAGWCGKPEAYPGQRPRRGSAVHQKGGFGHGFQDQERHSRPRGFRRQTFRRGGIH